MIVNSPDRFDLTERLPNDGSIEASTPTMFEIVAVGAIATQFELRHAAFGDPAAQRVPVELRGAIDLHISRASLRIAAATRLGEQIERVERQHAAVPRAIRQSSNSGPRSCARSVEAR